jgi:hypothetical protein
VKEIDAAPASTPIPLIYHIACKVKNLLYYDPLLTLLVIIPSYRPILFLHPKLSINVFIPCYHLMLLYIHWYNPHAITQWYHHMFSFHVFTSLLSSHVTITSYRPILNHMLSPHLTPHGYHPILSSHLITMLSTQSQFYVTTPCYHHR